MEHLAGSVQIDVKDGPPVGKHVIARAGRLITGQKEFTCGGQYHWFARVSWAGQRVTFWANNYRAADPIGTPLSPAPVGDRHEHSVDRGVGLRTDDLCGPFTGRRWAVGGPVHGCGYDIGTSKNRQAHPFRELKVVTDHQPDAGEPQIRDRRCSSTRSEDQLLGVPQM